MYAKNNNYVTFFTDKEAKHTEKVFYATVSESIKLSEEQIAKSDNPEKKYEFESWNARFVGKAREKAEELTDKTSIQLTEWNVRNPYNKETKRHYPYIMVMDFTIPESK